MRVASHFILMITPVVALEVAGRPGWPYWLTAGACVLLASVPWLLWGASLPAVLSFVAGSTMCGFAVLSLRALRARPFVGWLAGAGAVLLATMIAAGVGVEVGDLTP